jgi:uncharacterized membrane protein YccF (DUF307 family)
MLCRVLIVTIPFGIAAFRIGTYAPQFTLIPVSLMPLGAEIVSTDDPRALFRVA